VTGDVLKSVPLFKDGDAMFLEQVIMALRSRQVAPGDLVIHKGDVGRELYLVARGEVEVLDDVGNVLKVLRDGDIFGEIGLLMSTPRTADVRARTSCDLFVLEKSDFSRILRDSPQFAKAVMQVARDRYDVNVSQQALTAAK
jgi:CRP-like cAMP-binding protein